MIQDKIQTPLARQRWEQVTINEIYHAFLKGEFDKCIQCFGPHATANKALIDNPDFTDESQNCKRAVLLSFRAPLLFQIPCSTVWHKVTTLEESHLDELIVIGRCGWDDSNDKNELLNVAKRLNENFNQTLYGLDTPILWGHTKNGPFTIIEGNHRLVAYASLQNRPKLGIPAYVGLSKDYCFFHLPDPVT